MSSAIFAQKEEVSAGTVAANEPLFRGEAEVAANQRQIDAIFVLFPIFSTSFLGHFHSIHITIMIALFRELLNSDCRLRPTQIPTFSGDPIAQCT